MIVLFSVMSTVVGVMSGRPRGMAQKSRNSGVPGLLICNDSDSSAGMLLVVVLGRALRPE